MGGVGDVAGAGGALPPPAPRPGHDGTSVVVWASTVAGAPTLAPSWSLAGPGRTPSRVPGYPQRRQRVSPRTCKGANEGAAAATRPASRTGLTRRGANACPRVHVKVPTRVPESGQVGAIAGAAGPGSGARYPGAETGGYWPGRAAAGRRRGGCWSRCGTGRRRRGAVDVHGDGSADAAVAQVWTAPVTVGAGDDAVADGAGTGTCRGPQVPAGRAGHGRGRGQGTPSAGADPARQQEPTPAQAATVSFAV